MITNILDRIFGYDFYICHRQSDGAAYARNLAEALKNHHRKFDVFIDLKEFSAGGNIAAMQTRFFDLNSDD